MTDQTADLVLSSSHNFSWGDKIALSGFEDHDCFIFRADRHVISVLIVPRKPSFWEKILRRFR